MRRDFVITIKHDGRPLKGVNVQITSTVGGVTKSRFSGVTDLDGTVRASLPAGDYWLNANLFGITAAYECFHIAQQRSGHAKGRKTYEWGNSAPATRRIAGRLVDSEPGKGGTPLWNMAHRVEVRIRGASLKLQNPVNGDTFQTISDPDGAFAFDQIPKGTYVLHVEGGSTGRSYDASDFLIRLSPSAAGDSLTLTRTEPDDCGGVRLDLSGVDYVD
jgi:hypothetical protein